MQYNREFQIIIMGQIHLKTCSKYLDIVMQCSCKMQTVTMGLGENVNPKISNGIVEALMKKPACDICGSRMCLCAPSKTNYQRIEDHKRRMREDIEAKQRKIAYDLELQIREEQYYEDSVRKSFLECRKLNKELHPYEVDAPLIGGMRKNKANLYFIDKVEMQEVGARVNDNASNSDQRRREDVMAVVVVPTPALEINAVQDEYFNLNVTADVTKVDQSLLDSTGRREDYELFRVNRNDPSKNVKSTHVIDDNTILTRPLEDTMSHKVVRSVDLNTSYSEGYERGWIGINSLTNVGLHSQSTSRPVGVLTKMAEFEYYITNSVDVCIEVGGFGNEDVSLSLIPWAGLKPPPDHVDELNVLKRKVFLVRKGKNVFHYSIHLSDLLRVSRSDYEGNFFNYVYWLEEPKIPIRLWMYCMTDRQEPVRLRTLISISYYVTWTKPRDVLYLSVKDNVLTIVDRKDNKKSLSYVLGKEDDCSFSTYVSGFSSYRVAQSDIILRNPVEDVPKKKVFDKVMFISPSKFTVSDNRNALVTYDITRSISRQPHILREKTFFEKLPEYAGKDFDDNYDPD